VSALAEFDIGIAGVALKIGAANVSHSKLFVMALDLFWHL
jgi:hypothetical protein